MSPIEPFPPNPTHNSDLSDLTTEFDTLPIPTFDPIFFPHHSDSAAAPDFVTDIGLRDEDFELDLDFSFDDMYMDEDCPDLIHADHIGGVGGTAAGDQGSPLDSKDSNSFHNSEDQKEFCVTEPLNRAYGVEGCTNEADHQLRKSGERSSDSSRVNDSMFSETAVDDKQLTIGNPISTDHWSRKIGDYSCENSRPVSSQGSGNAGSGSEVFEFHSHDSDKDVSSKLPDCKIKVEEEGRKYIPKRKKESDDGIKESKILKLRTSTACTETDASGELDDEKRKARLIRNRESAQLSRQRKKHYVEELEEKVKAMHATIADLNGKISYLMTENASLRQQLGGGVMCPPPPGMYPCHPVAPMAYPWMPCPPYTLNGSQTPVVPIPRLKFQHPPPAPKSKKSDSKKTEVKTKKVASISLLGLLFFLFLFGALVPMMNLKYGVVSSLMYNQRLDRIITVNTNGNRSVNMIGSDFSKAMFDNEDKGRHHRASYVKVKNVDETSKEGNSSLPLVASLYVPRNDKLVKIDGNLIIHSVMASEKALASQKESATMESKKTGLTVAKNGAPAWAYSEAGRNRNRQLKMYKNQNKRRGALADSSTASADDDQQWFREGLAGPMLSSGLCSEVFQFDMSPEANPGAVIPAASSSMNKSSNHQSNTTELSKEINKRSLRGLTGLHNMTAEHLKSNYTQESLNSNKSSSPMIVSVLVDPKDVSDSEADGITGPKSLPRIFVVVLQERVKQLTNREPRLKESPSGAITQWAIQNIYARTNHILGDLQGKCPSVRSCRKPMTASKLAQSHTLHETEKRPNGKPELLFQELEERPKLPNLYN